MEKEITKKIRVYGIVQGVGFRPTVSRHADFCKIRGSVSNRGPYVEIFAQGSETAVNLFIEKFVPVRQNVQRFLRFQKKYWIQRKNIRTFLS